LKLIKENTFGYETLYETLQYLPGSKKKTGRSTALISTSSADRGNLLEKYSHAFQNLASLERQLKKFTTTEEVMGLFSNSLKRVLTLKEAAIFYFDESGAILTPVVKTTAPVSTHFINTANKAGILDWIFDSGRPTVVPEFDNFKASGARLSYLLIPIIEDKKKKGILSILTPQPAFAGNSIEDQLIEIMLSLVFAKLESFRRREEMQSAYNELQVYQSKLSNDFKLSAIGELTTGILEDILSPLQVIMSYTDFLSNDTNVDDKISAAIKSQVKKVEAVVERLVKFASLEDGKFKLQPCNLNRLIQEYHKVIATTLRNDNYECIIDFENDIPSILSSPNYIYQLLTNLFGLIKSSKSGGGILIQTKYVNEKVLVKIITTDHNPMLNSSAAKGKEDINLQIISNLMRKHEGYVQTDSSPKAGSVVVLSFPLKRKIRG